MIASANRIKIAVLIALACLTTLGQAHAATLTGEITLPDGQPAANVSLAFSSPWKDAQPAGQVTTSSDGTYTIDLKPGEYRILARYGTYIKTSAFYLNADGTTSGGDTSFVLPKGCMIMGMVIDQTTGQLLPDAVISVVDLPSVRTGPDGTFSILVPADRSVMVHVAKEGYARRWTMFMPTSKDLPVVKYEPQAQKIKDKNGLIWITGAPNNTQDVAALKFETRPDGVVKGTVTDEEGNPISGASVGVDSLGGGMAGLYAYTDSNGNYSIAGLDPEEPTGMSVRADGFANIFDQPISFQSGSREATRNFTLKLSDKRTITGRITRADGSPIKGAYIMYGFRSSDADKSTTTTDANGCYTLKDIVSHKSVLMAHYQGFAHSFALVPDKGNAKIDLVLQPGHTLEGRVVDSSGKPIAKARIGVNVPCLPMQEMGYTVTHSRYNVDGLTTDEDGRFRAENMPAGSVYISAGLKGYEYAEDVELPVDTKDNVVTLTPSTRFKGRVVDDADGTPITSFSVTTEQILTPLSFNSPDGTFSLSNTRVQSRYERYVRVSAPGYLLCGVPISGRPATNVTPDGVTEFRMKRAQTFSGRVTDNAGKPLEDVQVTLLGGEITVWGSFTHLSIPVIHARAGSDGRFTTETVPFTTGTIALQLDGYARKMLHKYQLSKPLETTLAPGATVTIDLKSVLGNVPNDASIDVKNRNTGENIGDFEPDAKGIVTVSNLSAGRHSFLLSYGSDWIACRDMDVTEGEKCTLDWTVKQPVTVTGTFTIKGKPFADARVLVHTSDGEVAAVTRTDNQGRYTTYVYEPGFYGIMCDKGEYGAPSYRSAQKRMELKAGTNRINGAVLCCSISGTIIDAKTKKPIPNAYVQPYEWTAAAWYESASYHSANAEPRWDPILNPVKADSQGRFRIDHLEPGDWIVAATMQPYSDVTLGVSRKFTLRPDEAKTDVVISAGQTNTGSASITVKDSSGAVINAIGRITGCVDSNGFVYRRTVTATDKGDYIEVNPTRTPDGGVLFDNLPAGKYRFVMPSIYLPNTDQRLLSASADFEVKPGKQTSVTVTAQPASAIVFRLTPKAIDALGPWVQLGYRILKSGTGEPVIKDAEGLKWGGLAYLGTGAQPDAPSPTATIALPPGEYTVEAVIRRNTFALYSDITPLWSINTTVKLEPNKDATIDIEIPQN